MPWTPLKVESYILVNKKPKEMEKPHMAEPTMLKFTLAKTTMTNPNTPKIEMPKHRFEVYNTHLPWLHTPFYHSIYKPSLLESFDLEPNQPSRDFPKFGSKPTPTHEKVQFGERWLNTTTLLDGGLDVSITKEIDQEPYQANTI